MAKLLHDSKGSPIEFGITDEGYWIPLTKAGDGNTLKQYVARCECAKSGRAKCRLCCEAIAKATVKIGFPMKWQGGRCMEAPYGWATSWAHPSCVRVSFPSIKGAKKPEHLIHGADGIAPKDIAYVVREVSREDIPETLKELRPDDEEFIAHSRPIKPHKEPEGLIQTLLPFQREGLTWMLEQEESKVKGGILADEMGMGKTIQAISMLLASKSKSGNKKGKGRRNNGSSGAGVTTTTLIVVPTSALMQWAEEISAFTKPGSLSVFIYYGDRSSVTKADLMRHDVVLTTYPIIEMEYRKVVGTMMVKCEYCGKRLLPRTLFIHQKYFCGPAAVKTERLLKREKKQKDVNEKAMVTLQIKSRTPTVTNVYRELMEEANRTPIPMYSKGRRAKQTEQQEQKEEPKVEDIEPAKAKRRGKRKNSGKAGGDEVSPLKEWENNFQAIEVQEQLRDQNGKLEKFSLLHGMQWGRIILDEAHKIKARTTSVAKSVYCLKGDKRWCLTGTPLQNRVGELYSLLRFLELDPFAYYFCRKKGCDCKSLHWNFGPMQRACESCGHPSPYHYSYFNRTILNPITRYGYLGQGKQAVLALKQTLEETQLRRTKKGRAEDVKIPELTVTVHRAKLDEKERDFYESLYKETQIKFDAYVKKGTLLHNYAHIFELLSRLRQTVNHPFLVLHKKDDTTNGTSAAAGLQSNGKEIRPICGLCQEETAPEDEASGDCGHTFHRTCMLQYLQALPPQGKLKCPVCFLKMTIDLSEPEEPEAGCVVVQEEATNSTGSARRKKSAHSIMSKINTKKFVTSSKIEGLIDCLLEMRDSGSEHKAIVFSQYTSFLDIVEWRIQKLGIRTVKMVGSMPISMRRSVLEAFKHVADVKILLLSLKAGGEGLNLQSATHVFVLEPWWNPAVEMQAIQRAHRIGQTKPVKAIRFCTEGTIEERMMELQEKKKLVFEGTIDNNIESLVRLNEDDIRFLFS